MAAAVFGAAQTPAPAKREPGGAGGRAAGGAGAAVTPAPWPVPGHIRGWLERQWLMITAVSAAVVLLALAIALSPLFPGTPPGSKRAAAKADSGVHRIDVFSGKATVLVNGQPLGETPVDYVGPIGETVKVELRQDGFEPLRQEIQMTTTGTSTFTMRRTGEAP
jgi:hypothetical protein